MTRGTRPSLEDRELALRLLREDVKVYEVSRQTGVSPDTLYRWAKREGVVLTPLRGSREGECEIEGCSSPVLAKRLCGMHYQRLSLHGTSDDLHPTALQRFREKMAEDTMTGCWIWIAGCYATGYGMLFYEGRVQPAHRVSYQLFKGPIPEGLHIDHLCSVRACVNPAHLEAVTIAENNRRTWERGRGGSQRRFNSSNTLEYMDWVMAE